MELRLTGLLASGLRCAEIDLSIDDGESTRFTFLQMPNGTGKTTISNCLRACLSGEAATWKREQVYAMQRRTGTAGTGKFEARFTLDGMPLAVGIEFDFVEGGCSYYTSHPPRGRKPRYDLPAPLGRFADANFVRLYIFDAELPQQLLSRDSTRADNAIEAFYQLYVLGQIEDALESYYTQVVEQRHGGTSTVLTRATNRLEQLRSRRNTIQAQHKSWTERLTTLDEEIAEKSHGLEERLEQIALYKARREEAQQELVEAEDKVRTSISEAQTRIQRPLNAHQLLRQRLDELAGALDSLKLPEQTSRQFFWDLCDEPFCICGRPMDDEARQSIEDSASRLLDDDSAGFINSFKVDVHVHRREEPVWSVRQGADALTLLIQERARASTKLEQLRDRTSAELDDAAQELNAEVEQRKKMRSTIASSVDDIEREPRATDDMDCQCLKWFDGEIARLNKRISEITETLELRERISLLQSSLADGCAAAAKSARVELVNATNERIESLLPGESIRVSEIAGSLKLEDRSGLNQGALLSVGYAFLTALFQRGNHKFPFVVDAPTMGVDGLGREKLAQLIPRVTHQFVGFVLDNERDFVRILHQEVPDECSYYTVFSDTSRNRPLASQASEFTPGPDGTYVIRGREFFDAVHWVEGNGDA